VELYSVSSDLDAVKIVQQMGSRFNGRMRVLRRILFKLLDLGREARS
jgi:hypothetical protein